jgi:outer membrane protein OmpA-like peptidoglycan-associated protein
MKTLIIAFAISLTNCSLVVAQNNSKYIINNVNINNEYSNSGASFYGNDFLVYESPRTVEPEIKQGRRRRFKRKPKRKIYRHSDFYCGTIDEFGNIINPQTMSKEVNSNFNEIDLVFTKDNKSVYFTRNTNIKNPEFEHLELYKADVITLALWKNVRKLPFNNEKYSVGHPTLSDDGKTLYFSSNMEGTLGMTDIFKVNILDDNNYSKPENLGSKINSSGDDTTPFISNNTLYFSTNGRGGYGNFDIFSVELNGDSEVTNLGSMINSEKDDSNFVLRRDNQSGYFTSNRSSGKGLNDIYYFQVISDDPIVNTFNKKPVKKETFKLEDVLVTNEKQNNITKTSKVIKSPASSANKEIKPEVVKTKIITEVVYQPSNKFLGYKVKKETATRVVVVTTNKKAKISTKNSKPKIVNKTTKTIIKIDDKINKVSKEVVKSKNIPAKKATKSEVVKTKIITEEVYQPSNKFLGYKMKKETVTREVIIKSDSKENKLISNNENKSNLKKVEIIISKDSDAKSSRNEKPEIIRTEIYQPTNKFLGYKPEKIVVETEIKASVKKDEFYIYDNAKCQDLIDNTDVIYFDTNKTYVRLDASNELDKVIKIMRRCANIKVTASSHTDSRGASAYNLYLSRQRANAVVKYILKNGPFSKNRVRGIGYGESKLKNDCADSVRCSKEEHKINRRTEITISSY